ncbi:hypothetical protein F0562_019272 [Nyssa sinensis]|uniref:D-isomer specific 2-hydroxyacid dehydrogenase NAD-binding domain-containing protein n=1 Tax=Nyssa sinensis TaxID=561372 RepID=A0A5J4ZBJ0_9ASTE|nr:hypothetical protein F0562_019272 [Nyssa sinensis]
MKSRESVNANTTSTSRSTGTMAHHNNAAPPLPSVVTLNCIEDTSLEQDRLAGVASVEYVPLSRLAEAKIESAAAVLLHSLAFLPRAAQRRLRPWQLVLCLGSSDRSVDSALAADLSLQRLVHVDVSRADEVADTVMALFLGLLRRTHLLSRHALSASGWLGSVQPLCQRHAPLPRPRVGDHRQICVRQVFGYSQLGFQDERALFRCSQGKRKIK